MFSAKNYGLPKDLIEAAKRVHEKQLMEYDEDGYINNPPEGMDKGTKKDREKAAKMGLKGPHLVGVGRSKQKLPPLPVRKPKPKNEEVQFTEEELAEAFAIFLEENFHVEMLTEEDLDYVFEEEFPQWLEEEAPGAANRRADEKLRKFLATQAKTPAAAAQKRAKDAEHKRIERENKRGASAERQRLDPRAEEDPMGDGSGVAKSVDRIVAKIKSAPKPAPAARKQVRRSAPKPQSFGALLRKVGGNAAATPDTAAGRRKIALFDARAKARTAARDARARKTGGQPSWAKAAFNPEGN